MVCEPHARANVDWVMAPFLLVPGCTGTLAARCALRASGQVWKAPAASQGPPERDFSAGNWETTPSSFPIFSHNSGAHVVVTGPSFPAPPYSPPTRGNPSLQVAAVAAKRVRSHPLCHPNPLGLSPLVQAALAPLTRDGHLLSSPPSGLSAQRAQHQAALWCQAQSPPRSRDQGPRSSTSAKSKEAP